MVGGIMPAVADFGYRGKGRQSKQEREAASSPSPHQANERTAWDRRR
jgi:hypothetical protein